VPQRRGSTPNAASASRAARIVGVRRADVTPGRIGRLHRRASAGAFEIADTEAPARVGSGPAVPLSEHLLSALAVTRPRPVSRQRRCSEVGALRCEGQIARATRGRDLHLNVPLPRKPPDLLMAESPPTGGLSALTDTQPLPVFARRGANLHARARLARYSSERERGGGRRRIRAGCRSVSP
jgi:hypothetical protein